MVRDADPGSHDRDDPVLAEPLPDADCRDRGAAHLGRAAGSPERLAGVAHRAAAEPDARLRQLHEAVRAAASAIRALSPAERDKRGVSHERREVTAAQVIESFIVGHAEEHLAQVKGALRPGA